MAEFQLPTGAPSSKMNFLDITSLCKAARLFHTWDMQPRGKFSNTNKWTVYHLKHIFSPFRIVPLHILQMRHFQATAAFSLSLQKPQAYVLVNGASPRSSFEKVNRTFHSCIH
jgi:hypothetical protein